MELLGLLCSRLSVVKGEPEKFFMACETGKGHVLWPLLYLASSPWIDRHVSKT